MGEDNEFSITWNEVPKIFLPEGKSSFKNEKCSICEASLEENMFLVEKAFWQDSLIFKHELIFEYFICADCAQNFNEQVSEESKLKLDAFRNKNFNSLYRQKLKDYNNHDIGKWLKYCEITKEKISTVEEYNIVGQFIGDIMLYDELPMAISIDGLMQIEKLYSNKTRDIIDDFMNSLPPDVRAKIKDKGRIFF
ncbi:MAG: hypothetical protein KAI79_13215 [Bacteroidales bacterium]|nr:hypothetical protein [Bacteroidales bacterium]